VLRGRLQHVHPQRASLGACDPAGRVDLDAAHAVRPDQDGVLQRPERSGVVARALCGHTLAVLLSEQHRGRDILRGLREDDRGRTLIHGQVPGASRLVVARMLREDDPSVQRRGKLTRTSR
jgi:hypothetical protein